MRTISFILCSALLALFSLAASAQKKETKEITGTITDSKGAALSGVTVNLKGTQRTTVTDANGKFQLSITGRNPVLQITSIGFEDQDVPVGAQTQLTVSLKETTKKLEDVVVVGYGTQRRRDLTGSISTVNSDQLTLGGTVANVGQAIQGKAAGVQVQQSDFSPGAGMNI